MERINEAQREGYVRDLYKAAANGSELAVSELSKIALGGYELARELVSKLDDDSPELKNKPVSTKIHQSNSGGVQLHDWPRIDRERMEQGLPPRRGSAPLHWDI